MSKLFSSQILFEINEENLPIRAEQIRTRLRTYPLMIVARVLVVLGVLALMWTKVAHPVLITWVVLMLTWYVAEAVTLWRYWDQTNTLEECLAWRRRLLLLVTLVGGTWGAGGMLLFVPGDLAYQAILICVVLGVAAGAITTNPVFPPALYIFVSLLIVPIMFANAWVGDSVHLILAGLLMAYLLYVLNAGRELAETFELSLVRALDNEELVHQLTAEKLRAERAQMQAELANVSKSKFLAAASHDLRQPMHALTMFVEALKPHVQGTQGGELMRQVETSVDVLGEMFDALLDISRLDAGVVEPRYQDVSLQHVLDRMAAEFTWTAQAKNINLYIAPYQGVLKTDPMLLERILRNLITNAIRYTERGEITVVSTAMDGSVNIDICDTGIGIAEHHLSRIFEEYYQVGNTQRDRKNGLGLGLAIVLRLSNLLGCKVAVRSNDGAGSCFSLVVPLQAVDVMIPAQVKA
ncbi:MAG: HAMP domain-containing sensor histidine kinase [Gallionella sp.]